MPTSPFYGDEDGHLPLQRDGDGHHRLQNDGGGDLHSVVQMALMHYHMFWHMSVNRLRVVPTSASCRRDGGGHHHFQNDDDCHLQLEEMGMARILRDTLSCFLCVYRD